MITEKAIEKHKYFTTGNGDMWIVGSIETVKVVQLHRIDQYGQGGVTDVADITLGSGRCKEFNPVTLPTRPAARPLYAVEDSKTEPVGPVNPVEKQKNSSSSAKKTKGRPSRTGYVGVQIRSTKRKGDRYYATVTESGKTKRIGETSYDSAELAAAARADYLGDEVGAARLRKLAEQKAAVAEFDGADGPVVYDCDSCGASYDDRPDQCPKCSGFAFSEIPGDAQAKAERYAASHNKNCGTE